MIGKNRTYYKKVLHCAKMLVARGQFVKVSRWISCEKEHLFRGTSLEVHFSQGRFVYRHTVNAIP